MSVESVKQRLHLLLVSLAVRLLPVNVNDKFARIFNVVDGQILSISQICHNLLIHGPFGARRDQENEPQQNQKPYETIEDESQHKEIPVNEDWLLVIFHFHVNKHALLSKTNHCEDVEKICGKRAVWSQENDLNCESNDTNNVNFGKKSLIHFKCVEFSCLLTRSYLPFSRFFKKLRGSIYENQQHCKEVEKDAMIHACHPRSERAESKEFLSLPNLVNVVHKFDFFLLNRFFVEFARNSI